MAKGSYHKNIPEEDDRNFKVQSATTNGAANSNVTYDTTVQSNSSAVASPSAEIPGIGMIYEVDVSLSCILISNLDTGSFFFFFLTLSSRGFCI